MSEGYRLTRMGIVAASIVLTLASGAAVSCNHDDNVARIEEGRLNAERAKAEEGKAMWDNMWRTKPADAK